MVLEPSETRYVRQETYRHDAGGLGGGASAGVI